MRFSVSWWLYREGGYTEKTDMEPFYQSPFYSIPTFPYRRKLSNTGRGYGCLERKNLPHGNLRQLP